jgi:hypothetical protein
MEIKPANMLVFGDFNLQFACFRDFMSLVTIYTCTLLTCTFQWASRLRLNSSCVFRVSASGTLTGETLTFSWFWY